MSKTREILLVNPQTPKPKGRKTMPRRRRRVTRRKPATAITRRNPGTFMTKARRAARSVGRSIMGINFKSIAQTIIPTQLGFFAFKAAAKFGADGMSADQNDRDSWNTASFFKGALGTFGAALLCKAFRPQWSQQVMEAGLNMAIYNLIQIKLIPNSEWAMSHLGEDEDYVPNEFSGGLHLAAEMPDGTPMFAGADGELYPADESYRMPENVSGAIVARNNLGDALIQPGRLGGADYLDPYRRAWGVPS